MQHPNHRLVGFLEGSLREEERTEVERHLAACPACRAELENLSDAGRALHAAAARIARPDFDPALWAKVRAQIGPKPRPRLFRLRWAAASGGLAATAVALVLIYVNGGRFDVGSDGMSEAPRPVPAVEPKGPRPAVRERRPAASPGKPMPKAVEPSLPMPVTKGPARQATERAPAAYPRPAQELRSNASAERRYPVMSDAAAPQPPVVAEPPPAREATPGVALKSAPTMAGKPSSAEPVGVAAGTEPQAAGTLDRAAAPAPGAPKAEGADRDGEYRMDKGGAQGFAPRAQRYIAEAEIARRNRQRAAEAVYLNNAINAGLTGEGLRAARLRLGDVFLEQGDATRALVEFREANRIRPSVDTLNRIGIACERTRDAEGAREAYEQALRLDPANAEAAAGIQRLKVSG